MKKSLSLLVAIAMVFSMFATLVSAADEKTAGQKLQDLGVINGTANGLDEDKEWKRQDITILLSRLLQVEEQAKVHANTHGFEDVNTSAYNGFISWAKENGYFTGKTETVFGINESITNAQFAAVLLRVLKVDVSYEEAFAKAVELKLVAEDAVATDAAIRGDIYVSLLTALDFKIDGKTLGNILGLPGYEITALDIVGASAVVGNSIVVEFNTDLEAVKNADVTVTNADGVVQLVEKVTVEGAKATIALSDKLSNGKTYTVKVAAAKSTQGFEAKDLTAEVTYNKAVPVSIAFGSKTVVTGKSVSVVVKDAKGNDITADYAADLDVYSSNSSVVDNELVAGNVGDAIVNVSILVDEDENETIETGNEVISVVSLTALTISDVSFGDTAATKNNTTLYVGDPAVDVLIQAKDQQNATYLNNAADFESVTIRSLNPSIVQVDTDNAKATAIQAGSATIQITVEVNGVKATKSVVVTVKAKRVLSGIDLSESTLRIVNPDSLTSGYNPIPYTVEVKTVDQYGDAFFNNTAVVTATPRTSGVEFDANEVGGTYASNANGKVVYAISGDDNGSNTIRFEVEIDGKKYAKTLSVTQANQNGLGGYVTEYTATLDINAQGANSASDSTNNTTIKVFAKDKNNVKFADVVADAVPAAPVFTSLNTDLVQVTNAGAVTISGTKTGKATITVNIQDNIVARVNIEVINTGAKLTTVKQLKETITVKSTDGNILNALFGSGSALELLDQYGADVAHADADYSIATSNSTIVDIDGDLTSGNTGKVTITVAINNAFYVVNVNVQ